ncbi:hypothetical protein UFOVP579_46 [uncultured Caudovirales phage]|uniref:Uncharacterized protein n=1 Tax=uncultured Caudovirales phage TaxID=2100421 RepID=A0A6J5LX67_9CAUD|nr:hypothetical protein UFOVP302_46 [uncultured Caudovirales phage]CAB4168747.1 hypothetical protein UFOVP579_46 [uncultured Caudovirales phage]
MTQTKQTSRLSFTAHNGKITNIDYIAYGWYEVTVSLDGTEIEHFNDELQTETHTPANKEVKYQTARGWLIEMIKDADSEIKELGTQRLINRAFIEAEIETTKNFKYIY